LICAINLAAQDEDKFNDEMTFEDFLKGLYDYPAEVKNRNMIEGSWGIGIPYFAPDKCDEQFANVYPLNFKYGFHRINPYMPIEDRFYQASEYIAIENLTSHFKPEEWEKDGNTVDIWRFTGGYMNGWGYINNDLHYGFNHTSWLGWARSDIELVSQDPENQKVLESYDEKYTFSTGFEASVTAEMFKDLYLRASYNRGILYPGFSFFEWAPGMLLEFAIQRTLDGFGKQLLEKNPDFFPIGNFLIKNSISFLLYELRKHNMFWPFDSDKPMNTYYFSIGISFVF
jgi:hypothetical protein